VCTILLLAFLVTFSPASDPAIRTLRVGVPVRQGPHSYLTPLVYWGGFATKSMCYEGLTRLGPDGSLQPGLAEAWAVSDDGRTVTLTLRAGIVDHDGRVLDAATVRDHLERWRGNPGNRWIGSTERMRSIEVLDSRRVRVSLSEPWPFLEECACAINPAYVVARGAYDHEGTFRRTVGTGPFRLVEESEGERFVYTPHRAWWDGGPRVDGVEILALPGGYAESGEPLRMLREGKLDLVLDHAGPILPREDLATLANDRRYRLWSGRGSSTTFLVLNTRQGPCADLETRRRLAAAVDREELVRVGELGWADPATTLFLAGWAGWPATGAILPPERLQGATTVPVRLLLGGEASPRIQRHTDTLARQLARAGFALAVETAADRDEFAARLVAGDFDLLMRSTHGVPYDPWISLQTLFLERPAGATASSTPPLLDDPELRDAILAAYGSPSPARAFPALQRHLDARAAIVPLFVPRRVAVGVAGIDGVEIGPNGYVLGLERATASALPPRPDAGTAAAKTPVARPTADPRDGEVPLPAADGWNAFLLLDNQGVGIWTVKSTQVFEELGCPEVVGLDDKGRCHILVSYSGKWTPMTTIADGSWLGGLAHGDIDPRVPGSELYTGSQKGHLYQVVVHPSSRLVDNRLIVALPGREIHTIVAGDLDPAVEGAELYVFTVPGGLFRVTPTGPDGTFEVKHLMDLQGRVRDAVVLPARPGAPAEVATVSRAGRLEILRFGPRGAEWSQVHATAMGMGRIALRPIRDPGDPLVLYTTLDDGRILRHERTSGDAWTTETIYLGPQGPRGVVAGFFGSDPGVETVAIYGYSHRIELLTRADGGWRAETIFEDVDQGHWLAVAEVEGRNGTQEIVASGFAGRIVMLSRPVGFVLDR